MSQTQSQQWQEEVHTYLQELAAATDQVRVSETLQSYLHTLARFHRYSWNNVILILIQRPDATRVAGYKTWQKLGRQVERGEKGLAIFYPLLKKEPGESGEETTRLVGFRVGHVFDVAQTSGDPLPEPPTWTNIGNEGDLVAQRLTRVAESLGIQVLTRELPGAVQGTSNGGIITLREGLSPKGRACTLAHELAHELLHQRYASEAPATEADQARQEREIEAEATAYTVCRYFGLETNSPNYLALWAADSAAIQARLARITYAAQRILALAERVVTPTPEAIAIPEAAYIAA